MYIYMNIYGAQGDRAGGQPGRGDAHTIYIYIYIYIYMACFFFFLTLSQSCSISELTTRLCSTTRSTCAITDCSYTKGTRAHTHRGRDPRVLPYSFIFT